MDQLLSIKPFPRIIIYIIGAFVFGLYNAMTMKFSGSRGVDIRVLYWIFTAAWLLWQIIIFVYHTEDRSVFRQNLLMILLSPFVFIGGFFFAAIPFLIFGISPVFSTG